MRARLLLAQVLERRGKNGAAKEEYKRILAADPKNSYARTRLEQLGG